MTTTLPISPEIKTLSLARAIVFALCLIVLDALYLNQGGIALLVVVGVLIVGLPRTFMKKFALVRSQRLRNLGIYLLAAVLVFVFNALNNRLAHSRAEVLISAVKEFHSKYQQHPKSLDELAPEFVEGVPVAKYTLMFNQFSYSSSEQGADLFYIALPPFGRPTYSFTRNEWYYSD